MTSSTRITSPNDLVTPYEETRAGFLKLALEKNRLATPFVEEAKALRIIAAKYSRPAELLENQNIRTALLAAAGYSDKALKHIPSDIQESAIGELVKNFLEPAGIDFVDELVFRFLLTKGDSLGGKMRNVGGILAEQKLLRTLIATLSVRGTPYFWLNRRLNQWIKGETDDPNVELEAKGISWLSHGRPRTLLLNIKVDVVGNNVDLSLLEHSPDLNSKVRFTSKTRGIQPQSFIALGELKGGVDPAGADEHWKTAISGLARIREAFNRVDLSPNLFFIGAAIANKMAQELFNQLKDGRLDRAANLTNEGQLFDMCEWIIGL